MDMFIDLIAVNISQGIHILNQVVQLKLCLNKIGEESKDLENLNQVLDLI